MKQNPLQLSKGNFFSAIEKPLLLFIETYITCYILFEKCYNSNIFFKLANRTKRQFKLPKGVGSSLIDAGINKILGGDGGGDSGSGDRTGLLVAEAENCPDLFPMVRHF